MADRQGPTNPHFLLGWSNAFRTSGGFSLRFRSDDQLPDFMSARIDTTIRKGMLAIAQAFVQQVPHPGLTVSGAVLQRGTGVTGGGGSTVKRNGDTFYRGTQAAHLGMATFQRHGGTNITQWARDELANSRARLGVSEADSYLALPDASVWLAKHEALEAATYMAPAFINQVEGKLERVLHAELQAVLPASIPAQPYDLRRLMESVGRGIFQVIVDPDLLARRIERVRGGELKETRQDPHDLSENLIFDGRGPTFLAAMIEEMRGPSSRFLTRVTRVCERLPEVAEETTALAVRVVEEREDLARVDLADAS